MPDVPELRLLTSPECQLCDHSKGVLSALADEGLLSWDELRDDEPEGAALAQAAPPLRPVLFHAGRVLAYGRLSERRLRKQLSNLGASAANG